MHSSGRVIYDFGANKGENIPYYLKVGDLVVAVEANPTLAQEIELRFKSAVDSRQLVVVNCVVTVDEGVESETFYVHKTSHVQSQFPLPDAAQMRNFDSLTVPARTPRSIIAEHGQPFYIKIDLERYDDVVLRSLFSCRIFPPFLSVEAHSMNVLVLLLSEPMYRSYNLVDGLTVSLRYAKSVVHGLRRSELYSFPHHSSGPFGEDLSTPWQTPQCFLKRMAVEGFGWKDIHVSTTLMPGLETDIPLRFILRHEIRRRAVRWTPRFVKVLYLKLRRLNY